MSKNNDFKAYVRYDANNQLVPGSLVFRKRKPAGKFKLVSDPSINICCSFTTTTTTTPPSYYRHVFLQLIECGGITAAEGASLQYYYTSVPTIVLGTVIYTDSALTTPFAGVDIMLNPSPYLQGVGVCYQTALTTGVVTVIN
jgi:hypothetical protein